MEIRQGNIILNVDEVDANDVEAKIFYEGVMCVASFGSITKRYEQGIKLMAVLLGLFAKSMDKENRDISNTWTTSGWSTQPKESVDE